MRLFCSESFAAQRGRASFPLCAAVIWLITAICSSRGAASSSLSTGWALSVSSRGVGGDGKQHPSALSSGILSVPYPLQVPKSSSVKHRSLKSQDWIDWLFWGCHTGSHPPTATVAHFTPAHVSICSLGSVADGGQDKEDAQHIPLWCSQPPEPPWGLGMEQPSGSKGVLRQYFPSACIWWVLMEDVGAEGSQVSLQNIIQNIWTEGKDRDTHGASSSTSKMLQSPVSC